MAIFFTLLVGVIAGLAAGILGIGGGLLVVPTLTIMGISGAKAVGTSTLTVMLTSLFGTYENWRKSQFKLGYAVPIAIPAAIVSQLGVQASVRMPESILLFSFGVFAVANIYLMSIKRSLAKKKDNEGANLQDYSLKSLLMFGSVGSVTGFFAGLFGVGGGVILVPLLVNVCRIRIKEAVALSLYSIFLTSIAALIGHYLKDNVLISTGLLFGAGGILGVRIGVRTFGGLSEVVVTRLFLILMLGVGSFMIYRGLALLSF